jgi:hypothetical protein
MESNFEINIRLKVVGKEIDVSFSNNGIVNPDDYNNAILALMSTVLKERDEQFTKNKVHMHVLDTQITKKLTRKNLFESADVDEFSQV